MRLIYENAHPNGLPEGFVELDCIQSDGRQYIQTELVPNAFTGADVVFETTTRNYGAYAVFGSRTAIGKKAFCMYTSYSEGTYMQFGSYNGQFKDATTNTFTPYRINGGRDGWFLDERELVGKTPVQFNGTIPVALFTVNEPSGPDSRILVGRIRRASFTHRGVAVANFIPCMREKDGEVGMFDVVGGRFYGNAGGGSFMAGTAIRYCDGITSPGSGANVKLRSPLVEGGAVELKLSVPESSSVVIPLTIGVGYVAFSNGKVGTNLDGASITYSSDRVYEPGRPFRLKVSGGQISVDGTDVMSNGYLDDHENAPVLFRSGLCTIYRCRVFGSDGETVVSDHRTATSEYGYGFLVDSLYHCTRESRNGRKLTPGVALPAWKLRIPYYIGRSARNSGVRTVWCESVPSEIRPLKYIEFDGGGYIDIKHAANTGSTAFSIDFSFTEAPSDSTTWWAIAGTRNLGCTGPSSMNLLYSRDQIRADWAKGESWVPRYNSVDIGVRHRMEVSRGFCRFDGEAYPVEPITSDPVEAEYGFLVGTFMNGGLGPFASGLKGRVYRVSISESGELRSNCIPAYHRKRHKYGLWDFRKGCFFEGSGSGRVTGK